MVSTQGGGSVSWTACLGFALPLIGSPGDSLGCWGQELCTNATEPCSEQEKPKTHLLTALHVLL